MATYIVKPNQNLYDVALHLYGNIEGLFDLLISNPEIDMTTDLKYGQSLEYHDTFILNPSVVKEFNAQGIVPSSGERKVYYKKPTSELIAVINVNKGAHEVSCSLSGLGEIDIDWGDNSPLEHITFPSSVFTISHCFDDEIDNRKIRLYGDHKTLEIYTLDVTKLKGGVKLCAPVKIGMFWCEDSAYDFHGLELARDIYWISVAGSVISSLLPLGDLHLTTLSLYKATVTDKNALEDYLFYVIDHYENRPPCTISFWGEVSKRSYDAINIILNEPEWNTPYPWRFEINGELYQPNNGTDSE